MAPVDEAGEPIRRPADSALVDDWRGTVADAALDAAAGERWLGEEPGGDFSKPWRATQRRWIHRLEQLLGLQAEQGPVLRETLRQALGLPLTDHAAAVARAGASRRLVSRAQAVVSVLPAVALDVGLWSRVLLAGHLAGLWAEPWLFEPLTGRISFLQQGTSPRRRPRGPP